MASFWSTFVVIVACILAAGATQVMHKPARYNQTEHTNPVGDTTPKQIAKRATGKTQFAYFTNWGIYAAYNFKPADIVPEPLTHILYSFADTSPDTGVALLTDSWSDEQIHYPGDSWNDVGNNLYGNLKQLYLLKLKKRNLKVLLSIGGWTYSQKGHFAFVTTPSKRTAFINSIITFIEDYGFDGIDIDFEYPANDEEATGYANLLTETRTALNQLASRKGDSVPYILSVAVPAGSANYEKLKISQMDSAIDFWNLMAYDYAGSWLTWADNQDNLYGGERTNTSTDKAVKYYVANGATASKINLGIPFYGRAFEETDGIGEPYNGVGPGTVEPGVYSYKYLPIAGAQVFESSSDGASYSYDSTKRELVSYDTPGIAKQKSQYILDNGLAGTMFWELSGDKAGAESLAGTTANLFGALDQTPNHISYPNSKWDNIRNNMGQSVQG